MGSNREIDEAIDRAVRDILSVEPRAGLRGRVLDRLERPAAGWFTLPRVAGAAALLAIVAISFLIPPAPQPLAPPTIASNTSTAPAPPPAPPPAAMPPRAAPRAASAPLRGVRPPPSLPAVRVPGPQVPAQGVVAAASVTGAGSVAGDLTDARDSIEPVAPLLAAVGAPPIAITIIQIAPLTIEPIVIAPIAPPR